MPALRRRVRLLGSQLRGRFDRLCFEGGEAGFQFLNRSGLLVDTAPLLLDPNGLLLRLPVLLLKLVQK